MKIYLTFNDCPNNDTNEILDTLKQYNLKACFFVLSLNALKYTSIMDRLTHEGHQVGLHGLNSSNWSKMSPQKIEEDLNKAIAILNSRHILPKLYRPPYGTLTIDGSNFFIGKKIKLMMWDIMVDGKDNPDPEDIIKQITEDDKDKIVCLRGSVLKILKIIIPELNKSVEFTIWDL